MTPFSERRPILVGDAVRAAFVYGRLMTRARLERRSRKVLGVFGGWLPANLAGRLLTAMAVCTVGWYAVGAVLSYAALFGLLRLVGPAASVGLMFTIMLFVAATTGYSVIGRTVAPADRERLLLSPLSDRQAYFLSVLGNNVLEVAGGLVLTPVVYGISASVVLGHEVSLTALWATLALVTVEGCALSLIVARTAGALWVRRMCRGARAGSVATYALLSAAAFGVGTLLSGLLGLLWASAGAGASNPGGDTDPLPATFARLAASAGPFEHLVGHPASPIGAPVRAVVEGSLPHLGACAAWAAAIVAVAAVSCSGGAGWHRMWTAGEPQTLGGDLFGLAERLYLGLARILYRGDLLLGVQLRNLCRQRQRDASGPFVLFGGPLVWGWAGLSWGAAPLLRNQTEVATVFVFVVGSLAALEHLRIAFEKYRGTLALEAEGRRAALYRVAGRGMFDLYRAKLRGSGLVGGVPLFTSLALIALLAELPLGLGVLLAAVGGAWLVAWPHVELLPGLLSPQFGWDHFEDLGGGLDQDLLYGAMEGLVVGAMSVVCLALVVLRLGGWTPPDVHAWLSSGVLLSTLAGLRAALSILSRRAARVADNTDVPA